MNTDRYAGNEDMYNIFVKYVVGDVVMLRDDQDRYTKDNMISKFGKIMALLKTNSKSLLLQILVARQFPRNVESDLHIIPWSGEFSQIGTWKSIGSGREIAEPLVEYF